MLEALTLDSLTFELYTEDREGIMSDLEKQTQTYVPYREAIPPPQE